MKVLVIGSNSFSGSDFVDLLLEDPHFDVVGLSRSPEKEDMYLPYKRHPSARFSFHQLDFNKDMEGIIALCQTFQPEYIVNFAAQSEVGPSWDAPWDWFQTNAVALSRLIHYLKDDKNLKKYVHISSPEIYGSCHGHVREDSHFNPSTPYAVSKAAADFLLFAYYKNFNFPLCVVRATNVYGAHQQLFKIVPRTIISARLGNRLDLHGGGKAIKSYIHVRDVSRGELAVMEKGKPGDVYHLSPDKSLSVRDVAATICRQLNIDFSTIVTDVEERLGQDNAYVIDSTKARKELGWSPQIPLEDGIDDVIAWIETHWEQIVHEPLEYIHKS